MRTLNQVRCGPGAVRPGGAGQLLAPRPLWIRLIIEFLGTFVLVTVAAGSG